MTGSGPVSACDLPGCIERELSDPLRPVVSVRFAASEQETASRFIRQFHDGYPL